MRLFTPQPKNYRLNLVNTYRSSPYRSKRVRGADYLYILISGLIVLGIVQKIEINKLKSATVAVMGKNITRAAVIPTPRVEYIVKKDPRVIKLEEYLNAKKSPLSPFAEMIVQESDKHGIDYTLIVSISGMESSFGVNTKQGCHNPFGLGGTKLLCFSSWEEAIRYEASLLDTSYRINMASGIQSKYCPPSECNPEWSRTIVGFAKEIMKGGEVK